MGHSVKEDIENFIKLLDGFTTDLKQYQFAVEVPKEDVVSHGDTQIRQGRTELTDMVRSLGEGKRELEETLDQTKEHLTLALTSSSLELQVSAYNLAKKVYGSTMAMFSTSSKHERAARGFLRLMTDNIAKTKALAETNKARTEAIEQLTAANKQLEQETAEMYEIMTHDRLTGAYNSFYFEHELEKEARQATEQKRPLTLIYFDLDGFRHINTYAGHRGGDEAIKQVVQRCLDRKQKRETDIFARYHGDEFVVLLSRSTLDQGAALAHNLLDELVATPFTIDGKNYDLAGSFGVAQYVPGETDESFVHRADKCLYFVKNVLGKRNVATENDVRKALLTADDAGRADIIVKAGLDEKLVNYYLAGGNPPKV